VCACHRLAAALQQGQFELYRPASAHFSQEPQPPMDADRRRWIRMLDCRI